jgi:hypothetical protein
MFARSHLVYHLPLNGAEMVEELPEVLYPQNVIEAFGVGAVLDLRVRLAADFLKTSPMFSRAADSVEPQQVAEYALDLADELLKRGAERGWVSPMPDDTRVDDQFRAHISRASQMGALQQIEGQRALQEEAGRVAVPGGRVLNQH